MPVELKHLGGRPARRGHTNTRLKPSSGVRVNEDVKALPDTSENSLEAHRAYCAGEKAYEKGKDISQCPSRFRPVLGKTPILFDRWKQGFLVKQIATEGPKPKMEDSKPEVKRQKKRTKSPKLRMNNPNLKAA